MAAKIIFLVQRYKPHIEATSKEVKVLFDYYTQSFLHDLHLDSYFQSALQRRRCSYHFILYPLIFPFLYLSTLNKIKHIYTNLVDFPYLPFLSKRKMIITSTNYFSRSHLQKRLPQLRQVAKIVVESKLQQEELLASGIPESKIKVIYPPVDVTAFQHRQVSGKKFKILNASCPAKTRDLERRGIFLLLLSIPLARETELTLLWREPEGEMHDFIRKVKNDTALEPIHIRKEVLSDMNVEYGKHHCTIIAYTALSPRLKLIPNSAVESLAAGKPLLVSSQTGMAAIVRKEKCGVVFEPTPESLLNAIKTLRKNYSLYQRNCRKTAEKYFSQELFILKYDEIYEQLENKK